MANVSQLVGDDGQNTLQGSNGPDLIYGFDPNGPEAVVSTIGATRVATGLSQPVFGTAVPGEPDHLYLAERTGAIKRLDLTTGQIQTVLDLSSQVTTVGEGGLLGLAFDPNFAQNGYFYVDLTNLNDDTEVRRYQITASDPAQADPASALQIISVDQPAGRTNHKAGWIGFGPDGDLYVSLGDGGGAGDPDGNGQNIGALLGKILRLDVRSDAFPSDPNRNYAIPADNPFLGTAGALPEIWALGLRNPFRISFDRALGTQYFADVGQDAFEEIDIGAAGANYGWNVFEGPASFEPGPLGPGTLTSPIYSYDHTVGAAIIGGYVYRGESEGLQGQYFFADEVSNKVFTLQQQGGSWVATERTNQITPDAGAINLPTAFGEDAVGNLYLVDLDGDIFRLTPNVSSADLGDNISGLDGDDTIYGGAGNDTIGGGVGNDVLYGNTGNDILDAGPGKDTLIGGAGSDSFVFATGYGPDTIIGFSPSGGDLLDLTGVPGIHLLSQALAHATQVGDDTVLDFGNGDTVTLSGIALSSLTAANFALSPRGSAPIVTNVLVADTGVSASDRITANPAMTGGGDANTTVTISEGSTPLGTTTASGSGVWSFSPSLTDGVHSLVVSETNVNGTGTASLTFTFDTTAPVVVIASSGGLTNQATQTIAGTVSDANPAANPTITLFDNGSQSGTTTAGGGTWSASVALSAGSNSLTAQAVDLAGNSGTSSAVVFALNTLDFVGSGDFEANHQRDFFYTTGGNAVLWSKSAGGFVMSTVPNAQMGAEWTPFGTGDFNHDQRDDILWTNNTGQVAVWLMNGTNLAGVGIPSGQMGAEWQAAALGDFNGDGNADVFWKSSGGTATIWSMNGTALGGVGTVPGQMGTEWHLVAPGDFNGDGKDDALWVSNSGDATVWTLNGTNLIELNNSIGHMSAGWHVAGVGDFNGDGTDDIVWVDNTNHTQIWNMVGGRVASMVNPSGLDGVEWHLQGVGDFTGDGKPDLLWLTNGGGADLWQVSGASITSMQQSAPHDQTLVF